MYDNLLEELKFMRNRREELKAETKAMLDAVRSTPNYTAAESELKSVSEAVETLEEQIRNTAVSEFKATGTKKVHQKVEVKLFSKFVIVSPSAVLAWVKQNLADALVFDEKKVKAYATKVGPVEGTELVEEPRAQIATEL